MVNNENWKKIRTQADNKNVALVAVSKTKPVKDMEALYELGQRDFGENYVQELVEKQQQLPNDIRWHYIGHLQTNKVKYIASFVHLIHTIDSYKLLEEVNKQAAKNNRVIDVLLQIYVAEEETKFGLDEDELSEIVDRYMAEQNKLINIKICGLMGMASYTNDEEKIRNEFRKIDKQFNAVKEKLSSPPCFKELSFGMSSDYEIAMEEGSTMIRVGSLLFGKRE